MSNLQENYKDQTITKIFNIGTISLNLKNSYINLLQFYQCRNGYNLQFTIEIRYNYQIFIKMQKHREFLGLNYIPI